MLPDAESQEPGKDKISKVARVWLDGPKTVPKDYGYK